jgi:hypothetical protein
VGEQVDHIRAGAEIVEEERRQCTVVDLEEVVGLTERTQHIHRLANILTRYTWS